MSHDIQSSDNQAKRQLQVEVEVDAGLKLQHHGNASGEISDRFVINKLSPIITKIKRKSLNSTISTSNIIKKTNINSHTHTNNAHQTHSDSLPWLKLNKRS